MDIEIDVGVVATAVVVSVGVVFTDVVAVGVSVGCSSTHPVMNVIASTDIKIKLIFASSPLIPTLP